MAPFTSLTAIAAPYEPINVDTDQIIPARFLKYPRAGGYGQFLFRDLRLADDGSEIAEFVLNREPYQRAKIFVGNTNFACGSSREGAVYAFSDFGIRGVIAPSFGDIFYNNCQKNGVVPVRLSAEICRQLRERLQASPGTMLTVDLLHLVVIEEDGTRHPFELPAFGRDMMLKGVDEVDLTLSLLVEIEAFEARYASEAPWIGGGTTPRT
ncbi:MAG: 3-isopropylmalate dehydratase small subunit [Betaproteobacteria bacterium]|nr:3-isopropylmalate dehydratase small subunit [Betaproteobacteria bacterium]